MTGNRINYLLLLLDSVVFYIAYPKWFSWFILLIMLLAPWFSLLLSLRAMFSTKLTLTVPEEVSCGDYAAVSLRLKGPVPFPPAVCRLRVTKPNTGETWKLRDGKALPTLYCGTLVIQPYSVKICDYLGLFGRKIRNLPAHTVRILPEPFPGKIPVPLSNHPAASWRPKRAGMDADNYEIRPYRPGDPLPRIHWKLSEKTDRLMFREAMEPEHGQIVLPMDITGTPEELDFSFASLLWESQWLLEKQIVFDIRAQSGRGTEQWIIRNDADLKRCMNALLSAPAIPVDKKSDTGRKKRDREERNG